MRVMKLSPVAIKLSLHSLTNVKKEKFLGITWFSGVLFRHRLHFDRYSANLPCVTLNILTRYWFFIQCFLLAILATTSKITHLPLNPSSGCRP